MRIIKAGNIKPQEWMFVCFKCGCEFAASDADKNIDTRDGDWVSCPFCKSYINWNRGMKL